MGCGESRFHDDRVNQEAIKGLPQKHIRRIRSRRRISQALHKVVTTTKNLSLKENNASTIVITSHSNPLYNYDNIHSLDKESRDDKDTTEANSNKEESNDATVSTQDSLLREVKEENEERQESILMSGSPSFRMYVDVDKNNQCKKEQTRAKDAPDCEQLPLAKNEEDMSQKESLTKTVGKDRKGWSLRKIILKHKVTSCNPAADSTTNMHM